METNDSATVCLVVEYHCHAAYSYPWAIRAASRFCGMVAGSGGCCSGAHDIVSAAIASQRAVCDRSLCGGVAGGVFLASGLAIP